MELLPAARPFSPVSHFNEWLYETIEPWVKGRVLEVDSGPGTLSSTFLQRERKIHLNSPDRQTRQHLRGKYEGLDTLSGVNDLDFRRPDFEAAYPEKYRRFDTILSLSSTENGTLSQDVILHAKHLLRERGRVIFLAPARTALLYGPEGNQEECKNYNRKDIRRLLAAEMEMLVTRYFIAEPNAVYHQSGLFVLAVARKIS